MEEKMERLNEIDRKIAELKESIDSVKGTETEVYTRIVGYYRSVKNWNLGKKEEYKVRKTFTGTGSSSEPTVSGRC